MATGLTEGGGVMSPTDVHGAGDLEWLDVGGMSAEHPLVGGPDVPGLGQFDVDRGRIRTVEGAGPATGGLAAIPDAPGVALIDSWRDLFNFRGSPMPWLLLGALIVLGLMEFRVQARARVAGRSASAGAAVG